MDEALVENAEHQINDEDREDEQHSHSLQRRLECLGRALERRIDRRRQTHLRGRLPDFADRL